jgi:hypothetical protein
MVITSVFTESPCLVSDTEKIEEKRESDKFTDIESLFPAIKTSSQ